MKRKVIEIEERRHMASAPGEHDGCALFMATCIGIKTNIWEENTLIISHLYSLGQDILTGVTTFVLCFLRASPAYLGSMASAVQLNGKHFTKSLEQVAASDCIHMNHNSQSQEF